MSSLGSDSSLDHSQSHERAPLLVQLPDSPSNAAPVSPPSGLPSPPSLPPAPFPPARSPSAAGTQIRFNFLRSVRNIRFSHISFCISLLVNIPQIVTVAYVLALRKFSASKLNDTIQTNCITHSASNNISIQQLNSSYHIAS
jgi:hypothetical protein